MLLLGVVYVPWHEGGVAPLSTPIFASLVLLAALLWLSGHALHQTRPRMPVLAAFCAALLLLQGWWMVVNARHTFDPVTHQLFPVAAGVLNGAPGSVDGKTSETSALNATAMLLALCVVCDLGRYGKWRKRFIYAIAINGAAVAAAGLYQKVTGENVPSGTGLARLQGVPFGPFDYHGNAGSFLILCLPAAFAVLLNGWQRGSSSTGRLVLRGLPLLLIVAGLIVNNSRAAQTVGVLMTMGLMGWAFWRLRRTEGDAREKAEGTSRRGRGWAVALAVVVLGAMVAGAVATTYRKWSMLPGQVSTMNPRLVMWRVCAYWLGDAGLLGYGPGTYKLIYPSTPEPLLHDLYPRWIVHPHTPGMPVSMWSMVHNDYLQLAVEWGWLGGAVWVVLLVGGVVTAVRAARGGGMGFADGTLAGCTAFALGGLMLHATVDFPLQVLALQAYVGVYLGLAWGSGRWPAEQREGGRGGETVRVVGVPADGDEVEGDTFKYN